MKIFARACIAALVVAGTAAAQEEGSNLDRAKENVNDASITARIETMFLLNEHLNPFRINTTTNNGVVTLEGNVDDAIERDLAEDLARSIKDVGQVENQLKIDPNREDDSDEKVRKDDRRLSVEHLRSNTQRANLRAIVRRQLEYNDRLDDADIDVEVDDDTVILTGTVSTEDQAEEAVYIAKNTRGVESVEERLDVRAAERHDDDIEEAAEATGEKVGDVIANIGRNLSDEWTEKRVETSLAFNKHVSMRDLDVDVEDGLCIITGTTLTEEQRQLIERIALRTDGVTKVENRVKVDIEPLERASRERKADDERGGA
jgi:osmotically-inducible protein OsmY